MTRLVVVSNRVPSAAELALEQEGAAGVGGLVSAVKTLMLRQQGLWMGWSGRTTTRRRSDPPTIELSGGPVELATIDLTLDEPNLYYLGFSNRTLWPLFHTFPERIDVRHDTFRAYQLVNERFAAVELTEATQVNPYDTDGTAEQLYQAVRMPHTERVRRWRSQMNAITENTARSWGEGFSQELQLS